MKMPARHLMYGLLWVALAALLSGCPFNGELLVQPGAVSLSLDQSQAQISLVNTASGTLSWTASTEESWLLLRHGEEGLAAREISGKTGKSDILTLFLDEEQLPFKGERLRGTVLIASSGGNSEVPVVFEPDREPRLVVNPATLSFGNSDTRKTVDVINEGAATLLWQARTSQTSSWLNVSPSSGELTAGSGQSLNITLDRSQLAASSDAYQGEVLFESNGGTQTLIVLAEAGAFSASPLELDFALIAVPETLVVTVRTQSAQAVSLDTEISYNNGENWLSLSPGSVEVSRSQAREFALTANPAGLEAGIYTASLSIAHEATGQVETIPVRLEVGKATDFSITPEEIDFGSTNESQQQSFTLSNAGDEAFAFVIKKQSAAPWLSVTPESGTLSDTTTITLNADPSLLPVGPAKVILEVQAGSQTRLVRVLIDRKPDIKEDKLEVEPRDLNFGSHQSKIDTNLWNDGPNAIDWFVDESTLPIWLSLSSSSGTLSGSHTDSISFTLNRELAPADVDSFSHVITVESGTEGVEPVELTLRAQPRRFPAIVLSGYGVDAGNVPYIMIDIGADSAQFTVENQGTAALTWNVDQTGLPAWISSIAPLQGELAPGKKQQVTVKTDRKDLDQTGGNYRLPIRSNDIDAPVSHVEIQVRVPFSIVIGTRPARLNFGRTQSTLSFEIANLGDAGWPLDYRVSSSQPEWLFAEPGRGRSMGTSGTVKDWKFVSVAIDRGRITHSGASASLTITAENVPPNAQPVEPVEVSVHLDLAELTIEAARPQYRQPSLIRSVVLLRDIRQQTFSLFEDDFFDSKTLYSLITPRVSIQENSQPIDLDETNVFVKKDEGLRFAVMILLDFSGSMSQAAQMLVDDGQLVVAPGEDPLTALYREAVAAMIDEMPPHYEVGLAVFNERNPWWNRATRVLTGAPAGYSDKDAAAFFTKNRAIQQYRLANMQVADNGATPLFPALSEAAVDLYNLGGNMPDFDNLGQSILISITDGRQTTPPGDLTALTDILNITRTRSFIIGWGNEIFANSLIQITDESGGHYYATANKRVPGEVDAAGNPLTIPLKDELLKWCRKTPGDDQARSLVSDLKSHVVVSYATLNEEPSMEMQVNFQVDTQIPPLTETMYVSQVPSIELANDVRLGQIGMQTEGIQSDGTARVRFYADYIPRNITGLSFNLVMEGGETWTAELVSADEGGLMSDWNMTRNGNRLTLTSKSTERPLSYADYGTLFDLHITGISAPTRLAVSLLDPLIQPGNPDGKYFTIPDGIDIEYEARKAVSFPNAEFDFDPPLFSDESPVIYLGRLQDLSPEERLVAVHIRNIGGEHRPTLAGLHWTIREGTEFLPGTWSGRFAFEYDTENPPYGTTHSIWEVDTAFVMPIGHYDTEDILISDAGTFSRSFYIDVNYGSLNYQFTYGPYYVQYDVD
ncbi:MAG: hypothetical protein GX130_01655 [Candidatus Hydrogenedens sp.]|nr:hypothetical protein [Candidatus Hydrogenedens sp.]